LYEEKFAFTAAGLLFLGELNGGMPDAGGCEELL